MSGSLVYVLYMSCKLLIPFVDKSFKKNEQFMKKFSRSHDLVKGHEQFINKSRRNCFNFHYWFKTCSQLVHNLFMTCSRLAHYLFMTFYCILATLQINLNYLTYTSVLDKLHLNCFTLIISLEMLRLNYFNHTTFLKLLYFIYLTRSTSLSFPKVTTLIG